MYLIEVKKSALKELAQISTPYNKKVIDAIDRLTFNPYRKVLRNYKAKKHLEFGLQIKGSFIQLKM